MADWPADLLELVKKTIALPSRPMKKPEFEFQLTSEAANRNFLVLRKYDFDIKTALKAQEGTPLEYGSEFRLARELEPIFQSHPMWGHLKKILLNGSNWPLDPLDEERRLADFEAALARGNHKGAQKKHELLEKLVEKDVVNGYSLPLPLGKLIRIPGTVLAPMNIAAQNTINELGQIIAKDRLTHDQSFDFSEKSSVNSRVRKDELQPCRYGHCIKRIINWLVAARRKHPGVKILSQKVDFKAAYRRMHLCWKVATQTCTHLPEKELALMALRLTFGGSPGPTEWGTLSESVTDLTNAILEHPDWDPTSLHSSYAHLIPARKDLPDDIPFGEGRELIVDVPVNDIGMSDIYIDDIFTACLDLPESDNIKRLEHAALLSIDVVARPLLEEEPLPREFLAALAKLLAEAGPEETKTMLGWFLDLRRLIISLPENKARAWNQEIDEMLEEGKTQAKRLERNIGRFVNIGMILPYVHHFLSRCRTLLRKAQNRHSAVTIPEAVREDLVLMKRVIERARNGVDMNNLAHRYPDHLYRNDSCPFGMGGYGVDGKAWRWIIPKELRFRASNNLLEHLANIVSVKLGLIDGDIKKGDCVLTMSDSMVSTSWLRKSNFDEEPEDDELDAVQAEVRASVAREHALTIMENEICEYPHWFEGVKNQVADALSRDDDRTDDELTDILKRHLPSQVPESFRIVQLPKEIISWLTSVLQKLPVKEQLRKEHTRTKIGRGRGGVSLQKNADSSTIFTSTDSQDLSAQESWEPLHQLCVKDDLQGHLMKPWLNQLLEMPSHMWLRPSGIRTGETQHSTKTVSLREFYQGNIELTATPIHQ